MPYLKLAGTITLLCFAAAADAESMKLFTSGHWKVHYVQTDYGPSCVASVDAGDAFFSLNISGAGLLGYFISENNYFGESLREGGVSIWVDGNHKWDTHAAAEKDAILMRGFNKGFLSEIRYGQRLFIDQDYDGRWDAWFSLDGSDAAMNALSDCADKL